MPSEYQISKMGLHLGHSCITDLQYSCWIHFQHKNIAISPIFGLWYKNQQIFPNVQNMVLFFSALSGIIAPNQAHTFFLSSTGSFKVSPIFLCCEQLPSALLVFIYCRGDNQGLANLQRGFHPRSLNSYRLSNCNSAQ